MCDSLTTAAAGAVLRGYARLSPTCRGGYRLVRGLRRCWPQNEWRGTFRTPDGFALDLDLGVYPDCCMAFGIYEREVRRWIRRLLRSGDHFVDVGANLGYFALIAAAAVGPEGRVDAFEPDPDNRVRLERHLSRNNNPRQVHVHAVALADRDGSAMLHRTTDPAAANHGQSSLLPHDALGDSGEVRLARFDTILPEARPHLIKIDVEGAEAAVVEGLRPLAESDTPPAIIAEHAPSCAPAGEDAAAFIHRLRSWQPRYSVRIIEWPSKLVDERFDVLARRGQVNVLLLPDRHKTLPQNRP